MEINDLVWQPGRPDTLGRVVLVRDYGFQIYVLSKGRIYWTFADQLEPVDCQDCEREIPLAEQQKAG